jgi:flagellar biosynthetic protein FliP
MNSKTIRATDGTDFTDESERSTAELSCPMLNGRVASASARFPESVKSVPSVAKFVFPRIGRICCLGLIFFILSVAISAHAESAPSTLNLNIGMNGISGINQPSDVDGAIKVLAIMTLLTLAPSIILLMTCFTRIVIVLSFVRSALSLQGTPSNQIIIGLSLFLTFFIMSPVWERINNEALTPYRNKEITSEVAMEKATVPIRSFMLKQTRPKDVELFVALAKIGPTAVDQLPLKIVIPSFIISELRTAFQMGFLIFVPFILIDLIVATVLMSMGMMMMPPATISLPLKILLFVLVDGWHLIVSSIVQSFGS